jgi:hypothetical protein
VFTQRAIKDLLTLLPSLDDTPHEARMDAAEPQRRNEADPKPQPESRPLLEDEIESPSADYLDIAPDELLDLLSGDIGPADEMADLDAFWDTTLTDDMSDNSTGISLDEALQRGILDFDQNSKPSE